MFRRSLLSFSVLLLLTFVLAVGSGFAAPATQLHPHASMRGSNSAAPCLSIANSGCIDYTETNSPLVKVPTPNIVVKGEHWPAGSEVTVFLVLASALCTGTQEAPAQPTPADSSGNFSASLSGLASGVVYGVCAKTTDGTTIYPKDNTKASPLTVELPPPCLTIGSSNCATPPSLPISLQGIIVAVTGQYWPSGAKVTVFLVPTGQPCTTTQSASSQPSAPVDTDGTFSASLTAPAGDAKYGVCATADDGKTTFPSDSTKASPLVVAIPAPCVVVANSHCMSASATQFPPAISLSGTTVTVTGQYWPAKAQITVSLVPSNQPCNSNAKSVVHQTPTADPNGNFSVTFTSLANGADYGVCVHAKQSEGDVTFPADSGKPSPLIVKTESKPVPPLDTFSALALLFALLATALYITSRGGYGPRPPLAGR